MDAYHAGVPTPYNIYAIQEFAPEYGSTDDILIIWSSYDDTKDALRQLVLYIDGVPHFGSGDQIWENMLSMGNGGYCVSLSKTNQAPEYLVYSYTTLVYTSNLMYIHRIFRRLIDLL